MKKALLSLTLFLSLATGSAVAVPAQPGKIRVKQPDGTWLTIVLRGDEYAHTAYTEDGYPLTLDSQGLRYEYATVNGGSLAASGIAATDIACRPAAARRFLSRIDKNALLTYNDEQQAAADTQRARLKAKAAQRAAVDGTRLRISDVPTTGSPKALVILVEFLDTKFSSQVGNAKTFYHDLLNKANYTNDYGATGSAYDFYSASSEGLYTPQFDVYGPVTVSQQESYYAGTSGQANVALMVYEAVKKLDKDIDFSQYDTDGDGQVDNIYFFYAGKGQADTGTSGLIWPHNAWVSLSNYNIVKDGVTIDRYACSSELNGKTGTPLGIGTFVHEFGHVLGIPDLYDTESQFTSGYTVGYWDTMCKGCYNNSQNTPPLYSAYERYALGWLQPTPLGASQVASETLRPLADENKAFLINAKTDGSEYFLLENRQQTGWDAYLPGHGLVVWHIDENQEAWSKNAVNNSINNPAGHKCIDIVEADGVSSLATEAGDAYPGTSNVASGLFASWAGKKVFALSGITETEGSVTFSLGSSSTGIDPAAVAMPTHTPLVYNLAGQQLSGETGDLPKGVYIKDGKCILK